MTLRVALLALMLFVVAVVGAASAASNSHASSVYRAGIYSVRADGTDRREIALPDPPVASLMRSPDGRTILFSRQVGEELALFAAERSGAAAVRLSPPGLAAWLDTGGDAFTPDGRTVAFTTQTVCGWRCAEYALYLVGRDGSGLRLVADGGREPSWAPDGLRLAYAGMNGIYVVDVRSGRTTYLGKGDRPIWAPRGERIAYSAVIRGYGVACFVNADRSRRRCTQGHSLTTLLWSPDAKRVAFRQAGSLQLGTVDPNARRVRYLGVHGGGRPVAWSPSGRRIVISYANYSFVDVLTVAKPRRVVRVVNEPRSNFSDFRWRGRRISYVASRQDN
jgi:Tol biopolymer transport system component